MRKLGHSTETPSIDWATNRSLIMAHKVEASLPELFISHTCSDIRRYHRCRREGPAPRTVREKEKERKRKSWTFRFPITKRKEKKSAFVNIGQREFICPVRQSKATLNKAAETATRTVTFLDSHIRWLEDPDNRCTLFSFFFFQTTGTMTGWHRRALTINNKRTKFPPTPTPEDRGS